MGRGMAIGDIDNDGRIDAVVTTNGGPAYVLLNETEPSDHWLTLRLIGHKSNRDGIGAVVEAEDCGRQAMGHRDDFQRVSVLERSARALWAWESPAAACIEVRWPSGIVQTLTDVKGDRQIQVDEP